MTCPNCKQLVEDGAAFCGNCGYKLKDRAAPPTYTAPVPDQQAGGNKALVSVLLGVIGIAGSVFMALIGLVFGLIGLVLGTNSRSAAKRGLSTAGIVLSSLSLLAGTAVWVYAFSHQQSVKKSRLAATNRSVVSSNVSTPCYSLSFADKLNVSNTSGSCDMRAFNGDTIENSTEAYKVYASKSSVTAVSEFSGLAKQAVEKDIRNNLPTYTVGRESVGTFAGSPDYVAVATDKAQGVTVSEAVVLHQTGGGNNVFVLVHAISGTSTGFSDLEAQWHWK